MQINQQDGNISLPESYKLKYSQKSGYSFPGKASSRKQEIVKYYIIEIIQITCHVVPQNDQEAVLNTFKPTRQNDKPQRTIFIEIY